MRKYYVTGVLVSITTGAIFFVFWRVFEESISMGNLIFFVPVGLLSGYFATKLETKLDGNELKKLGPMVLTIIMSIILTIIIFNLVWADFLGWFY